MKNERKQLSMNNLSKRLKRRNSQLSLIFKVKEEKTKRQESGNLINMKVAMIMRRQGEA